MLVLDVLYVALATIAVMTVLQLITFVVAKMMYPPEPKVIYRDVHVPMPQQQMMAPPPMFPPMQPPTQNGPVFTQQPQQQAKPLILLFKTIQEPLLFLKFLILHKVNLPLPTTTLL